MGALGKETQAQQVVTSRDVYSQWESQKEKQPVLGWSVCCVAFWGSLFLGTQVEL